MTDYNYSPDPEKAAKVTAEQARLMALFAGAERNKLDFIREHVQQLAWVNVSIVDLQKQIDEEGAVVPYQNGKNQSGLQKNPACQLLVDLQKLSNTSLRALLPVLPSGSSGPGKLNEFLQDLDLDNV